MATNINDNNTIDIMKRLIYILFAAIPFMVQAQVAIPTDDWDEDVCLDPVDPMPEFPGGQKALFEYLSNNVHYPEQAVKNRIEDRVICQFLVHADGSITDIEVVRSGGHPLLDEEAVRVIRSMPKWEWTRTPRQFVPMRYTLPINFKLH